MQVWREVLMGNSVVKFTEISKYSFFQWELLRNDKLKKFLKFSTNISCACFLPTFMCSYAIYIDIFSSGAGTCPISNRCFLDPIFSFLETTYFFHKKGVGTSHPSLAVAIVLESKMSCSKVRWVTWILACHNRNDPTSTLLFIGLWTKSLFFIQYLLERGKTKRDKGRKIKKGKKEKRCFHIQPPNPA